MLDLYPDDDDRSWIQRLTELFTGNDPAGLLPFTEVEETKRPAYEDSNRGVARTASDYDSASTVISGSLSDGGSISVNVELPNQGDLKVSAESDEAYRVEVVNYDAPGQTGNSTTSNETGSVSAGSGTNIDVPTAGQSATVKLVDESTDGGNSASATLIAKVI